MRFLILLSVFIFSCKSTGQRDELGVSLPLNSCLQQIFFSNPQADYISFTIGMSRVQFDEKHHYPTLFDSPVELIDSIDLCFNESSYCENAFRFSENKLSDIQSTFYLKNHDELTELRLELVQQLEQKYGTTITDKGIFTWHTEDGNRIIYIYLSDESVRYQRPVLQLQFISEGKISV